MARPRKDPFKDEFVTSVHFSCYPDLVRKIHKHKGRAKINEFIIEAVNKHCDDFSGYEKLLIENQELKKQNEELKKQLMFANTTIERLSKKKTTKPKTEINEALLIKFYTDKKLHDAISKFGNGVNWESLYDSNIGILSSSIGNPKELQRWCIDHYREG